MHALALENRFKQGVRRWMRPALRTDLKIENIAVRKWQTVCGWRLRREVATELKKADLARAEAIDHRQPQKRRRARISGPFSLICETLRARLLSLRRAMNEIAEGVPCNCR